jgi:hypothetical protein
MADLIEEAVAPLQRRIGELEAQLAKPIDLSSTVDRAVAEAVAALPVAKDGKDAEPVDVGAVIKSVLEQIPTPAAGKDGADGKNGADCDMDAVHRRLDEAVKALPVPKDGKDGAKGADGEDGINGERGLDGAKGADGLGLAGAMIDRDGALQVTFTNGEVKNLGPVVGKDGAHGADGKDGLSLDAFDMEYLPESHEIAIKASAAGRTKELRYPAGGIRPAGYWREGTKAHAGEAWVHDGSLWIATKTTPTKPATGDDWIIAARKGRDGERGAKGIDGSPPAPIKLKG